MADVIAGITNDRPVEFSVRDWAASELTSLGREALAEQGAASISKQWAAAASRIRPRQGHGRGSESWPVVMRPSGGALATST
jgi:hypothetical protein